MEAIAMWPTNAIPPEDASLSSGTCKERSFFRISSREFSPLEKREEEEEEEEEEEGGGKAGYQATDALWIATGDKGTTGRIFIRRAIERVGAALNFKSCTDRGVSLSWVERKMGVSNRILKRW